MAYPATLEVQTPDTIARWRPLFAAFLCIPHFIVLYGLMLVSGVVGLIAWFAIVFTGNMPPGLAGLQVMVLRYQQRVGLYAGYLHETYPPYDFSTELQDPGGTPVTVDVSAELEDRNRLTVGLRFIWAVPAVLFMMVVMIAASVVYLIGFFAVLILGRWPQGMRDFVVKAMRLSVQINAYTLLLTDEYPPFALTDDTLAVTSTTPAPPPPPPPAAPEPPAAPNA